MCVCVCVASPPWSLTPPTTTPPIPKVEHYADWQFRVEDANLAEICRHAELTSQTCLKAEDRPAFASGEIADLLKVTRLTWADLEAVNATYAAEARRMARKYGYSD